MLDRMVETTFTTEKGNGFKRNSTELWGKKDILGLNFVTFC